MRHSLWAGVLVAVLFPCRAVAVDKADIDRAIDAGLSSLRKLQKDGGRWDYPAVGTSVGATALAGLTLLECGANKEDPSVVGAAKYVRAQSVGLKYTYSIALSIVFLDVLGNPADEPVIESLAARLVAGQCATGAWYYNCPDSPTIDQQILQLEQTELATVPNRQRKELTETERKTLNFTRRVILLKQLTISTGEYLRGDNSNAMFAALALWVCLRHGLPVEGSLRAVDLRFRSTQNADGGWSYADVGVPIAGEPIDSTPSMTCAGLVCLAIGHGVRKDKDANSDKQEGKTKGDGKPSRDVRVDAGLKFLARTTIGMPLLALPRSNTPHAGVTVRPSLAGRNYYLLWGVERAAVTLDLDTIGNRDWYQWGAEILLATQRPDGAWEGTFFNGGVDTCFALLFLKRVNLAGDLASKLKGRFQDPGKVVLRSGGVGGEALNAHPKDEGAGSQVRPGKGSGATTTGRGLSLPKTDYLGNAPGAKLAEALLALPPDQQAAEIERLRDQKGTDNTEALATAIPYLSADSRRTAREALAARVARMKPETVGNYLQDEEPEIRRAAALACALKETKQLIPQLIALLSDREPLVARAAYAALKDLTGQDFGPAANADEVTRKQAANDWHDWWRKQPR
jgi:hypothetical protein